MSESVCESESATCLLQRGQSVREERKGRERGREKREREGAEQKPGASSGCDVRRESEGRWKGKVKQRQVEARAVLGRNRLKDIEDETTSLSVPL